MNINSSNKEIILEKQKKEIKFYIKESIKSFAKFILLPLKCLFLLTLNLINHFTPLLILLLVPLPLEGKLIATIIDIIICKVISKKIDTYVDNQLNYHQIYKASENLSIAVCNLGDSCRKFKNLKQDSSQQEMSTIETKETLPQKEVINLNSEENGQSKYSYHNQATQINTKFSESNDTSKKLKLIKNKNNKHNQADNS